jgi:hypothetical protein
MIGLFILDYMSETAVMPRRTIHLPETTEQLVREHVREGESFSATIVRLIELGASEDFEFESTPVDEEEYPLGYIGSGEGPPDLAINAEKYLGLKPWGPGEGPAPRPSDENPR